MANYATLKAAVQDVVKTNGNNEITGSLLQQTLLAIINSLGADFQFVGAATPSTTPGTPDQNVVYFAGPGTYPNFNSFVVPNGYLGVLKYNGSWNNTLIEVGKDYQNEFNAIYRYLGDEINIASYSLVNNAYINAENKWASTSNNKGSFVPVTPGTQVLIQANENETCEYAFLTNRTVSSGGTPAFVSGTQRNTLLAGQSIIVDIPAGCNYLQVNRTYGSTADHTPAVVCILFTRLQKYDDALVLLAEIQKILSVSIDFSTLTSLNNAYITSSNKWASSTSNRGSIIPVIPGERYLITAGSETCDYAFLTNNTVSSGGTPAFVSGTVRNTIESGQTEIITIPSGCNYLQFNRTYGSTADHTPQYAGLYLERIDKLEEKTNENSTDLATIKPVVQMLAQGKFGYTGVVPEWTNGKGVVVGTGELVDSSLLSATDYVATGENTRIELTVSVSNQTNTTRGIAFYDADKNYLSSIAYPYDYSLSARTYRKIQYQIPEEAAYFRTCLYTEFLQYFECFLINDNIIPASSGISKDDYVIGQPEIYHHPAIEQGTKGTTAAEIWGLYDDLVTQYPQWFRRETDIGVSSNNVAIRRYSLRNNENAVWTLGDYTNNVWANYYKYRKVLINAGTHGNEQSAVWGAYYFIKAVLESTENWAAFIRSNIEIQIVPILNPYGIDNNTRENANNVDINRQFSNTTCVEAQALKQCAIDLEPFCFLDCHSVGLTHGNYIGYIGVKKTHPNIGMMMRIANAMMAICQDDWTPLAQSVGLNNRPYMYGCLGANYTAAVSWMVDNVTLNAFVLEGLNVALNSVYGKPIAKIHVDLLANLIPAFMKIKQ